MTYPGGKAGNGVYQTIINQIPPHERYIEPFVGGGAVFRHKLPAESSIVIDADGDVVEKWRRFDVAAIHGCGIRYLETEPLKATDFVYADPPYLIATRRQHRPIYRCELEDEDHGRLLAAILDAPAMVAISGYDNELYNDRLGGWRKVQFTATTRGAPATETLWMNYPEPTELHDYRYLGQDFRERERIARKIRRWSNRLSSLPAMERNAILAELYPARPGAIARTDD